MYFPRGCRLYRDCEEFRFSDSCGHGITCILLSQEHVGKSAADMANGLLAGCSVVEIGEFFRFIAAYPDITEIDFENRQGPE